MIKYYQVDALNFSFLKFFLHSDPYYAVSKYNNSNPSKLYFEENEHLSRGNLLDCLITTPEMYDDIYFKDIIQEKPQDKIKSAIKYLFDVRVNDDFDNHTKTELLFALNREAFYHSDRKENGKLKSGGRDEDWRVDQLKQWSNYWEYLVKADNRVIITQDEIDLAHECQAHLINQYGELINKSEKQVALYLDMFGFFCKGLIDLAVIEDDSIEVIDLKSTSEPLYRIPKIIRDKKWIYQVVWYTLLLSKKYPNKDIKMPSLLISSTSAPDNPQLVKVSKKDFKIALKGNSKVLGLKDAIINYKKYLKGDKFSLNETNLWE